MRQQDALIDFIKNDILKDAGAKISAETELFKNNLVDSINILTLIGYVEDKLGRRLTDEEVVMSHFFSVSAIAKTFFND